jgi:hypothetical protein
MNGLSLTSPRKMKKMPRRIDRDFRTIAVLVILRDFSKNTNKLYLRELLLKRLFQK